jgi:hypothetical protein
MLRNLLCLIVVSVVCTGCVSVHTGDLDVTCEQKCKPTAKVFRHVLLFKFKESTTPEQIKEVENAFASLPGKISEIKRFEWGTNVNVENRSEGFTHCFVVTFANEAGLDAYMNHPDLKEFRKSLSGPLEKYLVIDYWATY